MSCGRFEAHTSAKALHTKSWFDSDSHGFRSLKDSSCTFVQKGKSLTTWRRRNAWNVQEISEARGEAADLVDLLKDRASELAVTLDADYPDLRSSIWLSEAAAQSAVQTLTPQMTENRKRVSWLADSEAPFLGHQMLSKA